MYETQLPIATLHSSRFADPASQDKLSEVHDKLEVVKSTMRDNIELALQSTDKMNNIEDSSAALNQKALDFRSGSKQLTDKMWWKMWKMRLLIGGLVISVLILIIVPTAVTMNKK